jgi:hypothetical protein
MTLEEKAWQIHEFQEKWGGLLFEDGRIKFLHFVWVHKLQDQFTFQTLRDKLYQVGREPSMGNQALLEQVIEYIRQIIDKMIIPTKLHKSW